MRLRFLFIFILCSSFVFAGGFPNTLTDINPQTGMLDLIVNVDNLGTNLSLGNNSLLGVDTIVPVIDDVLPPFQEGARFYVNGNTKKWCTWVYSPDVYACDGATYRRMVNKDDAIIPSCRAVTSGGSQGQRLGVVPACANCSNISDVIGLTMHNCSVGGTCWVMLSGTIRVGCDTTDWSIGDHLYLNNSGDGGLVNSQLALPNFNVHIGDVLTSEEDGDVNIDIDIKFNERPVFQDFAVRNQSVFLGDVGIGIIPSSNKLDVNGTTRFVGNSLINGTLKLDGNSSYGLGSQKPATTLYVQSRLLNMITNGNGLMGNNYNFETMTFDAIETHGGGGSFSYNGTGPGVRFSDELIPVDNSLTYKLEGWAKSGNADGSLYNSSTIHYFGIIEYDIDGNSILGSMTTKYSGSKDTFLTADLNVGDTVMYVDNATGWYNAGTATSRHFTWWPYRNSKGYSYPNYTYSRNYTGSSGPLGYYYNALGAWNASGVNTTTNIITLSRPWNGTNLSNGTAVRNGPEGSTYKYIGMSGLGIPNNWTRFTGYIGKESGTDIENTNEFRDGTSYIRILFLFNYPGQAADRNIVRWSDLSLTNVDTTSNVWANQNYTWYNENAPTLSVNDGNRVGINVINPVNRLDVEGAVVIGATYSGTNTAPTNGLFVEGQTGIGTSTMSGTGAKVQITAVGSSSTPPTLGTGANASLVLTGLNNAYGTLFGSLTNGDGYIQQQRIDGTGTAYNLLLQSRGGKVGIGTTSPTYQLDMNTTNPLLLKMLYDASTDSYFQIDGLTSGGIGFYNGAWGGDLNIFTKNLTGANNTNQLSLDGATGNVGVGTKNPVNKLEVNGSTNITNNLYVSNYTHIGGNVHIDGNLSVKRPYASFSSTQTQSPALANTAYPVTFNFTDDAYLINIANETNITFSQTGDYNIIISAIVSSSVANKHVDIWFRKNGVDIPRSNTHKEVANINAEYVIAASLIHDFMTNDTLQVMWGSDSTGMNLVYTTNSSYAPESPSIIMTVLKVSEVTNGG